MSATEINNSSGEKSLGYIRFNGFIKTTLPIFRLPIFDRLVQNFTDLSKLRRDNITLRRARQFLRQVSERGCEPHCSL